MADHSHQWGNSNEILGGRLSETCGCGVYCIIEFPPDGPPLRNIFPDRVTDAGFARREALTEDEEAHYREILGL